MYPELLYLLKVNLVFTVIWILYKLVIRRIQNPGPDRVALLVMPLLSLVLPLIRLSVQLEKNLLPPLIREAANTSSKAMSTGILNPEHSQFLPSTDWMKGLLFLYLAGSLIVFAFICTSLIRNYLIIRKYGIIHIEKNRIVPADNVLLPYSFMRYIVITPSRYDPDSIRIILLHENAHIRQKHYLDLFLYELLKLVFWINPAFWAGRNMLKDCHEHLADISTLQKGVDLKKYISLLLSHANARGALSFSNYFSKFNIYNRLKMIQNTTAIKRQKPYSRLIIVSLLFILSFGFLNSDFSIRESKSHDGDKVKVNEPASGIPSISPVDLAVVTHESGFGMRMHPFKKKEVMHKGHDFACPLGTAVIATADGQVLETGYYPEGYGKYIKIRHSRGFETLYSQLQSIEVNAGDKIKKGELIGKVGSSGMSTGPHLHYQVMLNGDAVDPEDYLNR